MPIDIENIETCYICGEVLDELISKDHVPMIQFYSKEVRRDENFNLLKLPVHDKCNKSFQHDEDYFIHTLIPFGAKTKTGKSLLEEKFKKYHEQGNQILLMNKVFREFEHTPSGIILPPDMVAKRFEGERVFRVAWKILRGLFFYNEGKIIPEDLPRSFEIKAPHEMPPDAFIAALGVKPILGDYTPAFAYRYAQISEVHNMWFWAFWLWESLTLCFAFHDLDCDCKVCISRGAD